MPEKQCNVNTDFPLAIATLTPGLEEECVDFSESVCTTTYDEEEILEDCDDAVQARCTIDDENCKQFVQLVRLTLFNTDSESKSTYKFNTPS